MIQVDEVEHEKLKRELMLTKLEKSRLEAVLSCVLLTNDVNIGEENVKNLTMSRSTLSSSTSTGRLSKSPRNGNGDPSPFQVRYTLYLQALQIFERGSFVA